MRGSALLFVLLLSGLAADRGAHAQSGSPAPERVFPDLKWANRDVHLGLVREGRFVPLDQADARLRLTAAPAREEAPERGEIDLAGMEGRLIALTGERGRTWMYSVEVRERAGPVVSSAVRRLWSSRERPPMPPPPDEGLR